MVPAAGNVFGSGRVLGADGAVVVGAGARRAPPQRRGANRSAVVRGDDAPQPAGDRARALLCSPTRPAASRSRRCAPRAGQVGPLAARSCSCSPWSASAPKAGVVPLHVWLPRAHPEAPSHVSALMSGAMVKLGVYGVVRVGWDLLGGGPAWWGAVVLAVGLVSAMFGILHALVASDLKRLLAYSTTENVGSDLRRSRRCRAVRRDREPFAGRVALAAAMLHVLNHAAFKGLLFLGAGSIHRQRARATSTVSEDLPGACRSPPPPSPSAPWQSPRFHR